MDGTIFPWAQILAYLVHKTRRFQLHLGFGHFDWWWPCLFVFFYPRPVLAFGYCRCLRVSVNHELVCAITRHKFELESPNLDQKNAKYFAQGPYCFGDWLGLTFQVKFYFIEKLCLFVSLLHLWNICETCLSNCSTSHMAPHIFSDNYLPTDRVTG